MIEHYSHNEAEACGPERGLRLSGNARGEDKIQQDVHTTFFPLDDGIREIVADWVRFLREEKLWGNDDPLFPATRVVLGSTRQFEAAGLEREHWSTTSAIRAIFREAFERAGLPYCHPHSLRKTLARLGEQACKSPEEFKAWSQNLGHEQVLTTFMSYGKVAAERQAEIIRGISMSKPSTQKTSRTQSSKSCGMQARAFQRDSDAFTLCHRVAKGQHLAAALGLLQIIGPPLHHLRPWLKVERVAPSTARCLSFCLSNWLSNEI